MCSEDGSTQIWKNSELFNDLRHPQHGSTCTSCHIYDTCRGECMAAKFFTGLPLGDPDPECVRGFGTKALTLWIRRTCHAPMSIIHAGVSTRQYP